jgi:hypothetical protein
MIELFSQFFVGGVVGVFGGTILIYTIGRIIVTLRDREVNRELEQIRQEHNKKIQKIQKDYNEARSTFLGLLGKYRRKILSMKVVDRETAKDLYGGDDATQPN